MKIQQADATWRNWSGSQLSSPHIFQPGEMNELQSLVKSQAQMRTVGAGHSFSPLAKTDEVLLNLDQFTGVVAFNQVKSQCTVKPVPVYII